MPFDLAKSFLVAAEQALGAKLPASYCTAMVRTNGGKLVAREDSWMLYPIKDTSDRRRLSRTVNHMVSETEVCRRWPRFPSDAVAFAGNGTGDHIVFVKQGAAFGSTVYVWLHETGALERVADDFAQLEEP